MSTPYYHVTLSETGATKVARWISACKAAGLIDGDVDPDLIECFDTWEDIACNWMRDLLSYGHLPKDAKITLSVTSAEPPTLLVMTFEDFHIHATKLF